MRFRDNMAIAEGNRAAAITAATTKTRPDCGRGM